MIIYYKRKTNRIINISTYGDINYWDSLDKRSFATQYISTNKPSFHTLTNLFKEVYADELNTLFYSGKTNKPMLKMK